MFFFSSETSRLSTWKQEENNEIESQFTSLGGLNFYFKEYIPFALSVTQVKSLNTDQD